LIKALKDESKAVWDNYDAYLSAAEAKKRYMASGYNPNTDYSLKMLNSTSLDELSLNAGYRDKKIADSGYDWGFMNHGFGTYHLQEFMELVLGGDKYANKIYDKYEELGSLWEKVGKDKLSDIILKYLRNKEIVPFDTGGYTGSWGAGARIAALHEKELVLNKQDTRNILDAVEILRTMGSALGTEIRANALAIAASMGARGWSNKFEAGERIVQ
jgi:hypothetical protein